MKTRYYQMYPVFLTLAITSCFAFSLGNFLLCSRVFATNLDNTANNSLSSLEEKFFQRAYVKEGVIPRLERLEKIVFGEVKGGSERERLDALLSVTPNLTAKTETTNTYTDSSAQPQPSFRALNNSKNAEQKKSREEINDGTKYPAVAAIEKHLLGKEFTTEAIGKRIERLELKAFGRTSSSSDLSERLDRLKRASGVDVGSQAPVGSDWTDEDDIDQPLTYTPEQTKTPAHGYDEDGKSFSGRDLRADMQRAFRPSYSPSQSNSYHGGYTSSGSYGMGNLPSTADANLGGNSGTYPRAAPDIVRQTPLPQAALGLSQQITLLENELFRKTYQGETIPVRLNRLESTVFPKQKPAVAQAIPSRVSRLLAAVPLPKAGYNSNPDYSYAEDWAYSSGGDGGNSNNIGNYNRQGQIRRPGNGFSRIMSGLSSLFTGGFVNGGYPAARNLATDPQTGLLYDPLTGNLIDPATGVIIGQRADPRLGSPLYSGYGGFGSFNSGFSPLGMNSYSMSGSGMRFGFGSGGIGLGAGLWP